MRPRRPTPTAGRRRDPTSGSCPNHADRHPSRGRSSAESAQATASPAESASASSRLASPPAPANTSPCRARRACPSSSSRTPSRLLRRRAGERGRDVSAGPDRALLAVGTLLTASRRSPVRGRAGHYAGVGIQAAAKLLDTAHSDFSHFATIGDMASAAFAWSSRQVVQFAFGHSIALDLAAEMVERPSHTSTLI
jgi:hypothetical protein